MRTWLVTVNAAAGARGELVRRTRRALEAHAIPAVIEAPPSATEARRVIDDAVRAGVGRYVAVGGDGTLNVVVDALMQHHWTQPPLVGVLPAGTGCDFARTFGLPQELEGAAAHLVGDQTYRTDVGLVEGAWGTRHFVNVAQAGIGGASAVIAERLPRWVGRVKYQAAFWSSLATFRSADVVVEAGVRRYEGPALAVIGANGQFFGGGLNIAPKATVVDGELDVQVFAVRKRSALSIFSRVKRGMHLGVPGVRRFRASEVSISTSRPWPVEADGDYLGTTPVRMRIIPAAVDLKI